jgi:hypothetical protein
MSGFAIPEIAAELAVFDDIRALGGYALIVIAKRSGPA